MRTTIDSRQNNCYNKQKGVTSTIIANYWLFILTEILATLILRIFVFEHYNELFINDSYIFLRYAENMAGGQGLVYNIGEKVLGYSSPLYVVLLAGLKFIFINLSFNIIVFILNLLLFTISSLFLAFLIRNWGIFGMVLFTFYCFYFPYVDAAVDGMGTMLMLTIIISALYAFKKGNMKITYILATLSLVMRPEGALFIAGVLIISFFINKTKPSISTIVICISILLLWLIPTYLYFGNILPNSMTSKSSLFSGSEWSGIHSGIFEKGMMMMFGLSDKIYFSFGHFTRIIIWTASVGFAILFAAGFLKALKGYRDIAVAAIFFILLLLFYSLGSPVRMFSWYTIVPSIIFMLVIMSGTENLLRDKIPVWLQWVSFSAVLLFCVMSIITALPERTNGINHELGKDEKLIKYLDNIAPGIQSIMISDIGYMGYWTNWRIIDGSGLVSPQVLVRKEGEKLSFLSDIFNSEKPDVIYFKVDILHSPVIDENMRFATFRNSTELDNFLDNYKEVSKAEDFAEIFVRKALLTEPNPNFLK